MSMQWSELITQAEEGGTFEAIPAGAYQAYVQDATAKPATTGKPMIVAVFEVTSGPYKGKRVWNNFVVSRENPNALAWFFKHMAALGLGKDFFAHNPSLEAVAAQLKGKQCGIEVGTKEWNGEMRNDIKKVTPAAAGGPGAAPSSFNPSAQATPAPAPQPTPEQAPAPGGAPPVPF